MDQQVNPMVSVIVPVYNSSKTLGRCLASLREQSYKRLELIFVNDCSTDDSLKILTAFWDEAGPTHDRAIKVLTHQVNRGVAAARNTALGAATGKYIYYVDPDDWIDAQAIELLVNEAERTGSDIVGCNWNLSFEFNERRMNQPSFSTPWQSLQLILNGRMRWNLWLFLVRREMYCKYGVRFLEGVDMGEDLMVTTKLFALARRVSHIDAALYHYGQSNEASITKTYSDRHVQQVNINIQEILDFLLANFPFQEQWINEHMHFLKLNIKLPLLISGAAENYDRWISWFPESNRYIWRNNAIPWRTRILQQFASWRWHWALRLHFYAVTKVIYGLIYR